MDRPCFEASENLSSVCDLLATGQSTHTAAAMATKAHGSFHGERYFMVDSTFPVAVRESAKSELVNGERKRKTLSVSSVSIF